MNKGKGNNAEKKISSTVKFKASKHHPCVFFFFCVCVFSTSVNILISETVIYQFVYHEAIGKQVLVSYTKFNNVDKDQKIRTDYIWKENNVRSTSNKFNSYSR